MGGPKLLALALAASAVAFAGARPASGQCRLCSTPETVGEQAPSATEVTLEIVTDLNFERLILSGEGEGTAEIRPDGSITAHGSIASASPRAMVGSAFVRGEPGRAVRVELPRHILLRSFNGGEIIFEEVVSDLPSLPRLDSAGKLEFRFGGRLRIRGDAEGEYHGDLPITAEYL